MHGQRNLKKNMIMMSGFSPWRPLNVKFVVDKVAQAQVSFCTVRSSAVSVTPPVLHIHNFAAGISCGKLHRLFPWVFFLHTVSF